MRIVVDAMGGDHAPSEIVQGALDAVSDDSKIEIILIGDEKKINDSFPPSSDKSSITIYHTPQTVEMTDRPAQVIKQKPNSSIVAGIEMIKSKKARAFVSAGSTGAIIAASLFLLGRIEGVRRPALGVFFPAGNNGLVLCDAGANSEAKPEHLFQFAIMASEYMSHIQGVNEPAVGLLNIGAEETKGNHLYLESHTLMKEYLLHFRGNVESRYLFEGKVDVVVCDGFLGNNLVKFAEGWISHVHRDISAQLKNQDESKEKSNEFKSIFSKAMRHFEYEEYGGVPLLGVNGDVIICHGSSPARAIKNAIFAAKKSAETNLVGSIRDDISSTVSLIDGIA
ncbi:MAG: phosphate acyltransferase PlsX [Candidatus Neomarinimicrobiota bacterium]|nr:phosphate acyltransferase PlsX [Candidatus Neomarinimicrobiota bacterium]